MVIKQSSVYPTVSDVIAYGILLRIPPEKANDVMVTFQLCNQF
jgi:hypothetical protein